MYSYSAAFEPSITDREAAINLFEPNRPRLEGKVALVFGAGSVAPGWGIGKAISCLFAQQGARVIAVDISAEAARITAEMIASNGGEAIALQADVSVDSDVQRAVSAAIGAYGRIDVLVNNVGIGKVAGPIEIQEADWDKVAAVNMKGPLLACKHVIPHMLRQGAGSIISTSSIAALRYVGYPHLAYSVTKAGLLQLSRMIALQYADKNVRVNCIIPGFIDTPRIAQTVTQALGEQDHDETRARRAGQCPMKRMGTASEVAYAALFLASDESSYVTGTEILVDGGLTAKFT